MKRSHIDLVANTWYDFTFFPLDSHGYQCDVLWKAYDAGEDEFVYGRTTDQELSQYNLNGAKAEFIASGKKLVAFLLTGDLLKPQYRPTIKVKEERDGLDL
jgi:hypothetical protein